MAEEEPAQLEPAGPSPTPAAEEEPEPLAREGEHVAPVHEGRAYHCPYCGVLAPMYWTRLGFQPVGRPVGSIAFTGAWTARCGVCHREQVWIVNDQQITEMVRPRVQGGPRPHPLMPDAVRHDYEEARGIVQLSPRGACALLRLATQRLVEELQPDGRDLDDRIGRLVARGLPEEVAQALDVLRVVGNNSVHPGELDMRDDVATATALFECLNHIVEERIARPKRIGGLFSKLPEGARQAIERRNARHAQGEPPQAAG
jgi:hypothetical protein